jgi:hypothetical protein
LENNRLAGKPLVSIISVGMSKFGKMDGLCGRELFAKAICEAFEKVPNLNPKTDVEALFVGHMSEFYEHQGHTGPTLAD